MNVGSTGHGLVCRQSLTMWDIVWTHACM